jgi:hypothetical protein
MSKSIVGSGEFHMNETESIVLHVESRDAKVKAAREETVSRVREYFKCHYQVPGNLKVLCFFDAEDPAELRYRFGAGNRGVHWPVKGGLMDWPDYMHSVVAPVDPNSYAVTWPFASLIYLYGSTCQNELGLTLTFAHELQHFLQYANERRLWEANVLLMQLVGDASMILKGIWEIPMERQARLVAKQVAENLYGKESVRQYVSTRINDSVAADDKEVQDWQFVQEIVADDPYNLAAETNRLVQQHKVRLIELQASQDYRKDPDCSVLDFESTDWLLTSDQARGVKY